RVGEAGLNRNSIVLFLDTFEELQSSRSDDVPCGDRGSHASTEIANWIRSLTQRGGMFQLKVVVSGRSNIESESLLGRHVVDAIQLDDLEPQYRQQLLESLGVEPQLSRELATVVGGNPLMLRLGARLISRIPAEQRADILGDLANRAQSLGKE